MIYDTSQLKVWIRYSFTLLYLIAVVLRATAIYFKLSEPPLRSYWVVLRLLNLGTEKILILKINFLPDVK